MIKNALITMLIDVRKQLIFKSDPKEIQLSCVKRPYRNILYFFASLILDNKHMLVWLNFSQAHMLL